MNNPFSLFGKTVLVTGASSGIGKSTALICAGMGARVILTGRNENRLKSTFDSMEGHGHMYILADLTDSKSLDSLVEQIPSIDGLVQCAGVGSRVPCKVVEEQDIFEVMDVNFNAPVLLQSLLLQKKKINKAASIVYISSRAAEMPSIGNALYSASKGAIISYAKCLALELAPRNIRVNCVCPAMVWTDLALVGASREELEIEQLKYPLKRYGNPSDVANLVVYMLSDASSWMTGSCVDITGGGEGTLV